MYLIRKINNTFVVYKHGITRFNDPPNVIERAAVFRTRHYELAKVACSFLNTLRRFA